MIEEESTFKKNSLSNQKKNKKLFKNNTINVSSTKREKKIQKKIRTMNL